MAEVAATVQPQSDASPRSGGGPLITVVLTAAVLLAGTAVVDPARLLLLAVPLSFLCAAHAAGAWPPRITGGPTGSGEEPVASLAVQLGVGLACLSLLFTLTAMGGVLLLAGLVAVPLIALGVWSAVRACVQVRLTKPGLASTIAGLACGSAWLLAWLWATTPPTFFDELVYHLVIPQRALATGSLPTLPWVFYTLMPHASDLLLSWGMALGGELGARSVQFAGWVLCGLAVWGLVRLLAGPGGSRWAPLAAVAALATSPMVWFLGVLSFAELWLTTAVILSALVLLKLPTIRPWLPLGLLLGVVATVKLAGLYWVGAILACASMLGWSRRDLAKTGLVSAACLAPWWARAASHTGNPIYPLGYRWLGGDLWSDDNQARLLADLPYGAEGLGLSGVLRLPVDLVWHPERFGSAGEAGGVAVAAACLLLGLPALTRAARCDPRTVRLGDAASLFVLLTGLCWVVTTPTTRFFAPALVLGLAVLAALILRLRAAGRGLALLLLAAAGLWGAARFVTQHAAVFSSVDVALGRESRDAHLARTLDQEAAARFVRERVPGRARLLFIGETRPYYFAREAVAPTALDAQPLERWVKDASSPEDLARRLSVEGITHVVLNVREFARLRRQYGLLKFNGEGAEEQERRLKALPGTLKTRFQAHGVYVFEVPVTAAGGSGP